MSNTIRAAVAAVCLLVSPVLVVSWIGSSKDRLAEEEVAAKSEASGVPLAAAADVGYCTPSLKRILRRVLKSCGLINNGESGGGGGRGCQPLDAKSVATMSGDDFNALFLPMKDRGGIVQFEKAKAELDQLDMALVDKIFADQRGASYFFIVARASPEGSVTVNRELSKARAQGLMSHLQTTFNDPDLGREVGLLWLGEEFAQLDEQFCEWQRSGEEEECKPEDINRSAFVAWIDCRL